MLMTQFLKTEIQVEFLLAQKEFYVFCPQKRQKSNKVQGSMLKAEGLNLKVKRI